MRTSIEALRLLGRMIRETRITSELTQNALGLRAGIVGKYVSEIERGTRDVPFSTLHAIVEGGFGLRLDVRFKTNGDNASTLPALPRSVEELARAIAELPARERGQVVAIIRAVLGLSRR